jgi:hypothetical protein
VNGVRRVQLAHVLESEQASCLACPWQYKGDQLARAAQGHAAVTGHDVTVTAIEVSTYALLPEGDQEVTP